jgi:hypothetical protein
METEQLFQLGFGIAALLCALSIALVSIDRQELRKHSYFMPVISLLRFPAYRWGTVIVLGLTGIYFFALLFGWL